MDRSTNYLGKYRADFLLGASLLFGVLAAFYPVLILFLAVLTFLGGIVTAIISSRLVTRTYLYAVLLGGTELLIRMSEVPLFHEFTKYAVALILGLELIRYGKFSPNIMILYGLCLVPGVLIVEGDFSFVRKIVSANLSGPFCLLVCTLYFYNRPIRVADLRSLFLCFLCPLGAMVGFLVVNTPDLSQVDFGVTSNFETSVWGPNQVSSILGLGVLIIGLSFFLKIRLFGAITSVIFLGMLLFRGLLTFSRGGMIAPLLVLLIVFAFLSWYSLRMNTSPGRIVLVAISLACIVYLSFAYTNEITDNALYDRYAGVRKGHEANLEDYSSGRTLILSIDWQIFKDHYALGVGAGMGKAMRSNYGYPFDVAAHNEFTRLLAEHGLPGVFALLILLGLPAVVFLRKRRIGDKAFMMAMVGFCFAFMMHSATRIAIPLILYGLAFSNIQSATDTRKLADRLRLRLHRKKLEPQVKLDM